MSGIKIGIGRVSTKEQNPQRQIDAFLEAGVDERNIFIDKASGEVGNMANRIEYQRARTIACKGDIVYLDALDRLGRNAKEIEREWRYFTEEVGTDMVVLNMPILDTRGRFEDDPTGDLISGIVLKLMAWMAQKETEERRRRQRGGIDAARRAGKYLGRRPVQVDTEKFTQLQREVEAKEQTNDYAMKKLGLKRTTYYKMVNEYRTKTGRFRSAGANE